MGTVDSTDSPKWSSITETRNVGVVGVMDTGGL